MVTEQQWNRPTQITITLSGREVAIMGAMLRCCTGWTSPQELQRFVNVAGEHVRHGFTEAEMDGVLETLAGAWLDRPPAAPSSASPSSQPGAIPSP